VVLNTAVADVLSGFADELEKADDLRAAVEQIVVDTITRHKRILFSGNSYSDEWKAEAEKRGLLNLPSTPDALPYLIQPRNIALFERQRVYTSEELHSRYEIQLENYCKIIAIEGHTMLDMVNKEIIPAVITYSKTVSDSALAKRAFLPDLSLPCEEKLVRNLNKLLCGISEKAMELEACMNALPALQTPLARARHCRDSIFQAMEALRILVDQAEMITDEKAWPFPGYGKLLTTK